MFCKRTHHFKEPTTRSHHISVWVNIHTPGLARETRLINEITARVSLYEARDFMRQVTIFGKLSLYAARHSTNHQMRLASEMTWRGKLLSLYAARHFMRQVTIWSHHIKSPYEVTIWSHHMKSPYEVTIWSHHMKSRYEVTIWSHDMKSPYEVTIWSHDMNPEMRLASESHDCMSRNSHTRLAKRDLPHKW